MSKKTFKALLVTSLVFLLTSCASIVTKPAMNKVRTVAVVSIVSSETILDKKTNQPYRTSINIKIAAMARKKSLSGAAPEEESILNYIRNVVNGSPEIITSELANVNGWAMKKPALFVETEEYKNFVTSINDIWRQHSTSYSRITPYDNGMPFIPSGIVLFAKGKHAASNEQYKEICNKLGVDAVALISANYEYDLKKRLIGSNTIVPLVTLGIKVINKDGEVAVEQYGISTTSEKEVKVTTAFTRGFKFDENPEEAYNNTLKASLKDMVARINKAL